SMSMNEGGALFGACSTEQSARVDATCLLPAAGARLPAAEAHRRASPALPGDLMATPPGPRSVRAGGRQRPARWAAARARGRRDHVSRRGRVSPRRRDQTAARAPGGGAVRARLDPLPARPLSRRDRGAQRPAAILLIALAVDRDRVREIRVIGNPDKLRGV